MNGKTAFLHHERPSLGREEEGTERKKPFLDYLLSAHLGNRRRKKLLTSLVYNERTPRSHSLRVSPPLARVRRASEREEASEERKGGKERA